MTGSLKARWMSAKSSVRNRRARRKRPIEEQKSKVQPKTGIAFCETTRKARGRRKCCKSWSQLAARIAPMLPIGHLSAPAKPTLLMHGKAILKNGVECQSNTTMKPTRGCEQCEPSKLKPEPIKWPASKAPRTHG